jgi:hypothetical protein
MDAKMADPSYTSIMVGTHADSIVAEAVNKGFKGFDYNLAFQAVLPGRDDSPKQRYDEALGRSLGHAAISRARRPDVS